MEQNKAGTANKLDTFVARFLNTWITTQISL